MVLEHVHQYLDHVNGCMIQNVYKIDRAYVSHVFIMVLEHFHQYLMCEDTKSKIDRAACTSDLYGPGACSFINILMTDDRELLL